MNMWAGKMSGKLFSFFLVIALMDGSGAFAQSWEDGMYRDGMHQMSWPEQLPAVSLSGKTIVDTSRVREMMGFMAGRSFFLDVNGDGNRSYEMYFGPYWYVPASGAKRPSNGESVTVRAAVISQMTPPMLVIYEIDGMKWRDSPGAPPWSGKWIRRNISDTVQVFCPIDSFTTAGFAAGFMGTGMMGGGMMWPDSIYCDLDEMHPDSLPGMQQGRSVMGFHLDVFNPQGQMMMQGGSQGHGMMGFQMPVRMRFRGNPDSLQRRGLSMSQVTLFYLDTDNQWKVAPGQIFDAETNTISLSSADAYSYYAIAPTVATAIAVERQIVPSAFSLDQNFPNPFNPSTRIFFSIPSELHVSLYVYDLLGRLVTRLIDSDLPAGKHSARFDARGLPSGAYIYRLQAGSFVEEKRMQLVK